MLDDLLAGIRQKDRRALARLISLTSRGEHLDELRSKLVSVEKPSIVVAFTGGGGVGKSSLVGKLIEKLREHGRSVAVLACDPESPLTGGALLGDRFRMPSRPDDAGVYIRSLAAVPGRQAVADHLDAIILLCRQFGFDFVLLETVGAGQGDTAVRGLADAVVLLLQPETGDELQWEKAGVLEVADAVVIHKSDLPGADRAASQVKAALELSGGHGVPVMHVSSRKGTGLDELTAFIESISKRVRTDTDAAKELLNLAQEELAERFKRPGVTGIVSDWKAGKMATAEAIRRALNLASGASDGPGGCPRSS
jgi:LAO/AO transport system ATPase